MFLNIAAIISVIQGHFADWDFFVCTLTFSKAAFPSLIMTPNWVAIPHIPSLDSLHKQELEEGIQTGEDCTVIYLLYSCGIFYSGLGKLQVYILKKLIDCKYCKSF